MLNQRKQIVTGSRRNFASLLYGRFRPSRLSGGLKSPFMARRSDACRFLIPTLDGDFFLNAPMAPPGSQRTCAQTSATNDPGSRNMSAMVHTRGGPENDFPAASI